MQECVPSRIARARLPMSRRVLETTMAREQLIFWVPSKNEYGKHLESV
jgi:hypothetical protein